MKQLGVLRFVVAAGLIALTAILLEARGRTELVPSRLPLSSFPAQLGDWRGQDIPLDKETLDVLGAGDFLVRNYRAQDPRLPEVDLFLAYFPSQRTGDTIHSPKNCLPGAGWTPLESGRLQIQNVDGSSMSVNRYVVGKGPSRALVLYWYQAHGRITASEDWAKIRRARDA